MPKQHTCHLFFLGTQHHRHNAKGRYNIVNQFFKHTVEDEFAHKRLFDGPGGVADSDNKKKENPVPGSYYVDFDTGIKKHIRERKAKIYRKMVDKFFLMSGSLLGVGVKDNIIEALQYLEVLKHQGKLPAKINLYGFSRGGDTSIILSNFLYSLYPEVEVNLCLVDPVPGGTDIKRHESVVIPPNVKNMTTILMQDEAMVGFDPVDQQRMVISSPTTTRVNYQIYRGYHGSSTLGKNNEISQAAHVLSHDTFFKFAQANGTPMRDDKVPPCGYRIGQKHGDEYLYEDESLFPNGMSQQERLVQFQKMQDATQSIKHPKLMKERNISLSVQRGDYHEDPDFFINQEHRELFALSFPAIFNYLFKKNMLSYSSKEILAEIREIYLNTDYPITLYLSLYKRGIMYEPLTEQILFAPSPSGTSTTEKFPITQGLPVVHDEESYLKYAVKSIAGYIEVACEHYSIVKLLNRIIPFNRQALSISSALRQSLDKFNHSTEPDSKKIADLKQEIVKQYERYYSSKMTKKSDILAGILTASVTTPYFFAKTFHKLSFMGGAMEQQLFSLVEADLYAIQINNTINMAMNSQSDGFFRKSNQSMPVEHSKQLAAFQDNINSIRNNHTMPDRDKISAMNAIIQSTRDYIGTAISVDDTQNSKPWKKNLRKLSNALQTIELKYTTYTDRIADKFSKIEKKHAMFARVCKLIHFTKIGRKLYNQHYICMQKATLVQRQCELLKKSGNGNNKDEISKLLDNLIYVNLLGTNANVATELYSVAKTLKKEINMLRGTKSQFMRHQ